MPFISNTEQQRGQMLNEIGLSMAELFGDIPSDLMCEAFDLPAGLSEQEVTRRLAETAAKNRSDIRCFLGGGFYDHFIPAAVGAITSRSEFYTAYTPYQPELSQGTLQAIYEFQSAICRLTGMEAANASLYDGGTAVYEAMMMAMRLTGREKIIVDDSLNPIYRSMLRCYTRNLGVELCETKNVGGLINRRSILELIDGKTAAVILQNPNFFGCVDDFSDVAGAAHEKGALLIVSCYPVSLGLLKPPGQMGADIVVGEGQSLGLPLSFGGPYLGFMATRKEFVRKMPGRIVGQTKDKLGRRAFVLTLQAREQHIRRDKATSNICSNEALCALAALVYMSLMGREGLKKTAVLCADRARSAFQKLTAIDGVKGRFANSFFNEFVLDLPCKASDVMARLLEKGFAAGFPLGRYYEGMENSLLAAVTEKRTKKEIDSFAAALESCL